MAILEHHPASEELSSRTGIERMALQWFVRLRGNPGLADRRKFDAWLAEAPEHRTIFHEIEQAWRGSDPAAHVLLRRDRSAIDRLVAGIDAQERRCSVNGWRRAAMAVAASVCLMVIGAGIWLEAPTFVQDLAADEVTHRGELRRVTLADGSTVLMEADTALSLDIGADIRRVRLLRGAAFFSVVSASVPFVVASADGEVRVVGTQFEVRRRGADTSVTVASGKVRVQSPDQSSATLSPGQQVLYGRSALGEVAEADLQDAFAWQQGRLVFYHAPLRDVIARLEQYHSGRIVILNDELADRLVSGSFSSRDPEEALESLGSIFGFRHQTIAGHLTLLR